MQSLDSFAAVFGEDDLHPALFERRGEGEHVANVVVDHQHLATVQRGVPVRICPSSSRVWDGSVASGPVQEQRGAVDQPLG